MDESGFEEGGCRMYGWGEFGKKVYGEHTGNTHSRTSLIAGKSGKKLLAPFLFDGNTDADWFNQWLEYHLFKELPKGATVIMDNASFHKTAKTRELFENSDFNLLFLPPYSPDFNPIEQDFAIMKKRKIYQNASLDEIVKMYNSYLE